MIAQKALDAGLLLVIDGDSYELKAEEGTPFVPVRWSVHKVGSSRAAYSVTQGLAGNQACTCDGFGYRGHCRHVKGLRKVGLLKAGS